MRGRKPASRVRAWSGFLPASLLTALVAITLRVHVFGVRTEDFTTGDAWFFSVVIAGFVLLAVHAGFLLLLVSWRSLRERPSGRLFLGSVLAGGLVPFLCVLLSVRAPRFVSTYAAGPIQGSLFYFVLLTVESLVLSWGLMSLVLWVLHDD